jgi:hypothetical protein
LSDIVEVEFAEDVTPVGVSGVNAEVEVVSDFLSSRGKSELF